MLQWHWRSESRRTAQAGGVGESPNLLFIAPALQVLILYTERNEKSLIELEENNLKVTELVNKLRTVGDSL